MLYPSRPLISEPFVSQLETIDKSWIKAQSQPSYFPRRNNRPVRMNHQNAASPQSPNHYNKWSYYPSSQEYYGGHRRGIRRMDGTATAVNSLNGVNSTNTSSFAAVCGVKPNLSLGTLSPSVPQIPEVFPENNFSETKVFGQPILPSFTESKPETFSTFDPFAGDINFSGGAFFRPSMFAPSSNVSGTGLSSSSSSIWRNSKTIGDAAVWG